MSDFSIHYDTISQSDELDSSTALKIFTFEPPQKAERGKEKIRLMITAQLRGNKPVDRAKLINLINALATRFYQSSGPVTSALKGIIDQFNAELFDANMSTTSKGIFQNGNIVVLALRESALYIVQSGLSKVFHITQLGKTFFEPDLAGKGAGLSSIARMYFAQAQVDNNDKFIIVFEPEEKVEKGIESLTQISSFDIIQHRLAMIAKNLIFGSIFHFQHAPEPEFIPVVSSDVQKGDIPKTTFNEFDNIEAPEIIGEPDPTNQNSKDFPNNHQRSERRKRSDRGTGSPNPAEWLLGALLMFKRGIQFLRDLSPEVIKHLIPDADESKASKAYRNLSIVAAILLPIIFLLYANFYYGTYGYLARYNTYLDKAESLLSFANGREDPIEKKDYFRRALEEIGLAKASVSKLDERGSRLLGEAQIPLDYLEKVTRLDLVPSLSQRLPSDHKIEQMVVTDTEIYLLDETENKVLRFVYNGTRYDKDGGFICGNGVVTTDDPPGKILTILPISRGPNQPNTIIALDQNAKLIYCGPGKSQEIKPLLLPSRGIKSVTSAVIQGRMILLLDAGSRAIWVYGANENLEFDQQPEFYFSDDIQISFGDTVDMAYSGGILYLLNAKGELTVCSNSQVGDVVCLSPYEFTDTRPGMHSGITLTDGNFGKVVTNRLPIESVLFLDKAQKAIFRFNGLTMELQGKYLPNLNSIDKVIIENEFRSFAVNESNRVFILVGDQIYSAELFD